MLRYMVSFFEVTMLLQMMVVVTVTMMMMVMTIVMTTGSTDLIVLRCLAPGLLHLRRGHAAQVWQHQRGTGSTSILPHIDLYTLTLTTSKTTTTKTTTTKTTITNTTTMNTTTNTTNIWCSV